MITNHLKKHGFLTEIELVPMTVYLGITKGNA